MPSRKETANIVTDEPGAASGVTEALLAGYGLLGKPAPAYVALPALPVTRENLVDAWKSIYHSEAPASLIKALEPPG
jgi:ribose transport system substrate-binding protein